MNSLLNPRLTHRVFNCLPSVQVPIVPYTIGYPSAAVSNTTTSQGLLLNFNQKAGYKKRQTSKLTHTPDFTEYDKLPGDEYQTTYYGYYDGERHNEPRALERFYRLNWGGWVRARGGRGTRMWQKDGPRMWWTKQHILCSDRQSEQLEKMFEKKYRKKTFFVDDPYEVYEERSNFEFLPIGHKPYSYSYIKAKDYQ